MGRNQHNAGLHFIRYTHKEDLSVYDEIVAGQTEQREREKRRFERFRKYANAEQERKAEEEALGIFPREKREQVKRERLSYLIPPKAICNEPIHTHFNTSVFDKCNKEKPGQKYLLDAGSILWPAQTVLINICKIAYQKKKNLTHIFNAVDAIMHDDIIANSDSYINERPPYGSTLTMIGLFAEALECEIYELFKDDEASTRQNVYDLIQWLRYEYADDVYYDEDGFFTSIEFNDIDNIWGSDYLIQQRIRPTKFSFEKVALIHGGWNYQIYVSIGYTIGAVENHFFRDFIFYEELHGNLEQFINKMIQEDRSSIKKSY